MSDLVYASFALVAFGLACVGMWWDVCRQCVKAQHELTLDELWDDGEAAG